MSRTRGQLPHRIRAKRAEVDHSLCREGAPAKESRIYKVVFRTSEIPAIQKFLEGIKTEASKAGASVEVHSVEANGWVGRPELARWRSIATDRFVTGDTSWQEVRKAFKKLEEFVRDQRGYSCELRKQPIPVPSVKDFFYTSDDRLRDFPFGGNQDLFTEFTLTVSKTFTGCICVESYRYKDTSEIWPRYSCSCSWCSPDNEHGAERAGVRVNLRNAALDYNTHGDLDELDY